LDEETMGRINSNNEQRMGSQYDPCNEVSYTTITTLATKKCSPNNSSSSSSSGGSTHSVSNLDRGNIHVVTAATSTIASKSRSSSKPVLPQYNDDVVEDEERQRKGCKLILETIRNVPDDRYDNYPLSLWYQYPYAALQKLRLISGYAVTNNVVQTMIVILIVINSLLLGVATSSFVYNSTHISDIFNIVDTIFLSIFTAEILLQLFYRGLSLFHDGWLTFDFIIIVFCWSLQSIQVIRAFRIFRALRLVTRLRTLRELIMALGAVMPRMYAISMLLVLIIYIFAVLFTQLFGDLQLSENYFTSLDASLFTCMDMMTLNWADIAREVMIYKSWAWAPFFSYISITGFIVYNLIVAVVCDAVAVMDRKQQQIKQDELEQQEQENETDREDDQLRDALERIHVLSEQMQLIKRQHVDMCHGIRLLTCELDRSKVIIETLQANVQQ
jgi:hypothetical protein